MKIKRLPACSAERAPLYLVRATATVLKTKLKVGFITRTGTNLSRSTKKCKGYNLHIDGPKLSHTKTMEDSKKI